MSKMSNVLLLSQIAGHVVNIILSLCITVPMIFHTIDFNGHCLLFATGDWDENSGLFNVKWSSIYYCAYTKAFAITVISMSCLQFCRLVKISDVQCSGYKNNHIIAIFQ